MRELRMQVGSHRCAVRRRARGRMRRIRCCLSVGLELVLLSEGLCLGVMSRGQVRRAGLHGELVLSVHC